MISTGGVTYYVTWWSFLVNWAAAVVPLDSARTLASRALSLMYLRACRGEETLDGPYMASIDELYGLVCKDLSLYDNMSTIGLFKEMYRPCDETLYQFCLLYSAAYEISYITKLSLHDRERMALLIGKWEPVVLTRGEIRLRVQAITEVKHPLRRVFETAQLHVHNEELICEVAADLSKKEHLKSRRWLAEGMTETEGTK